MMPAGSSRYFGVDLYQDSVNAGHERVFEGAQWCKSMSYQQFVPAELLYQRIHFGRDWLNSHGLTPEVPEGVQ